MKQEAALSIEEETKLNFCNCDANLPVALTDSGTITNSSALPMVKLYFGGLTYEIQYATFSLGRLKCYGIFQSRYFVSLIIYVFQGEQKVNYLLFLLKAIWIFQVRLLQHQGR